MEQNRSNVVDVPPFFFILKVVQIAIAVLVLGLSAASIALLDGYWFSGGPGYAIFVVSSAPINPLIVATPWKITMAITALNSAPFFFV
jgi:hypothetical protein